MAALPSNRPSDKQPVVIVIFGSVVAWLIGVPIRDIQPSNDKHQERRTTSYWRSMRKDELPKDGLCRILSLDGGGAKGFYN